MPSPGKALPGDTPGVVVFHGSINADSVDTLIVSHAGEPLQRLIVESQGGEIGAGMRLGTWILDRGLDVEVVGICGSSCANYVFAAGRRKIIDDGAIVVWHGSALQKGFRAIVEDCLRRRNVRDRADGELAGAQLDAHADESPLCAYGAEMQRRQAAFFARIGASEYITRLGQEPRDFESAWTVPVETMVGLGYRGVEAPADYASVAYVRRFNRLGVIDPILSLRRLDDGSIREVAR